MPTLYPLPLSEGFRYDLLTPKRRPPTNHRQQQQDTANDDGHHNGRLAAPQLQCGDGLVEVPHLDLRTVGVGQHIRLCQSYASALLTGVCSEPHRPQMTTVTPGQRGSARQTVI